ncbi:MAG: nucleotidyltransferase family protein [Synechococcaceae cyanobacterium]
MPGSTLITSAGIPPAVDRLDLLDRLRADASTLRALGRARCAIFGSFARAQRIHPDSDVDLLVTFQPGRKDFDTFLQLADHLEAILARPVDLVTTEGLSRHLAETVLGEAVDVALGA